MFPRQTKRTETGFGEALELSGTLAALDDALFDSPAVISAVVVVLVG